MIFNPIDKFYKSQIGAVCEKTPVTFRVMGDFKDCVFVLRRDFCDDKTYYSMQKKDGYFECVVEFSLGLYWYYFQIDEDSFISINDALEGEISSEIKEFQLSVYDSNFLTPKWIQGGIIYQIFPDRFNRSKDKKIIKEKNKVYHDDLTKNPVFAPNKNGQVMNNDFFGGDFKGVIEKLDYLKELNVSAIYFNPIFKAFSNHRYDTGDYMVIDQLLGSEDDFKLLIKEAKARGIDIILDGVFNHTGDDSIFFNKYNNYNSLGAFQDSNSPYKDWYKFINYPSTYESWWGITTLPAVNKENLEYINYITGTDGVLQKYLKMGVKGWRLDVVDELPANFVRKIRSSVKEVDADAIIIGEVWEDASNKIAYDERREYFLGKELDSVMNYPLKDAIINYVKSGDTYLLSKTVKEQIDHYPTFVLNSLMNILSTHDTFRILSSLSDHDFSDMSKEQMSNFYLQDEQLLVAKQRLKVATLLQFTFCGVPSIYYGEEVGMQGLRDPLNRKFFPWGNEDVEILSWYKFISKLRTDYSCFASGNFIEIYNQDGVYGYKRFDENSEIAIFLNMTERDIGLDFDGSLFDLFNECFLENKATIEPFSFKILANK